MPDSTQTASIQTDSSHTDSSQTVLLADDEANILMLLEMELQAEGFAVVTASDGVTAMKLLREAPPALALSLIHI